MTTYVFNQWLTIHFFVLLKEKCIMKKLHTKVFYNTEELVQPFKSSLRATNLYTKKYVINTLANNWKQPYQPDLVYNRKCVKDVKQNNRIVTFLGNH